MGPIGRPETSVSNHLMSRNNPEDEGIQLERCACNPTLLTHSNQVSGMLIHNAAMFIVSHVPHKPFQLFCSDPMSDKVSGSSYSQE
jgi:hypothetical protein